MVCLHHSQAKHLLLAPFWGRILGSPWTFGLTRSGGYIHLLCFSQDVKHPSFAKEMLTACRDVSDPSESLSCVFFFFFFASRKHRIKTRSSGGTKSWAGEGGKGGGGEGNETRLLHHCPAGS